MKLGDFLKDAPEAPTRPVEFRILGRDGVGLAVRNTARARFAFVDEAARQTALREAHGFLLEEYKGLEVPPDRRHDENTYHILYRALRDEDDVRQPFAASVDQLRKALVAQVAGQLITAYWEWVREEFPDTVTASAIAEIEKEAEGNSESARP